MDPKESLVTFYQVQSNQEKIQQLIFVAKEHFEQKIPFLFLTQDTYATQFLDELLWKMPQDSFLPHKTEETEENCFLTISMNLPKEPPLHVFNLQKEPLSAPIYHIFEFDDQSAQAKEHMQFYMSQKRKMISLQAV